jgi:putative inorganic carbon (HCO3(-)) transporter
MKNNSENKLYWLYLTGIFLILTLPLLSVPPLFHPAPWGKSIVFRIIFSILIFFFIWQILFLKDNTFFTIVKKVLSPKNKIFWPFLFLAAFFGLLLLATIFSLDPHFSFWGSPYRGGSFLTFGFIILFAFFLFLILKEKNWQRIIDFTIGIGDITAIIAVFQKLGLFSKYMVSYQWRPVATLGGPIFFALYLILLIFLAFALGISTPGKKKIFYFSSFILMFIGIILAATRAVFLGFFVGFLFFIFAYPKEFGSEKINRKIFWLKISIAAIAILSIFGLAALKTRPDIVNTLKQNRLLGATFERAWSITENPLSATLFGSRGSGWKVALEAIKDRPILGYGPENFSIGFDKFYDPTLPGIKKQPGGSSTGWWDRGHSFIFDIGVTAGLPALIIYLLLFAVLFQRLQRLKQDRPEKAILAHGIQTTFVGYLIADFFSFDVFSTYLILFLIIAYSLHLISLNAVQAAKERIGARQEDIIRKDDRYNKTEPGKYAFISVLFVVLVWFIWAGNLKPLFINKKINQYVFLADKIYNLHYSNLALAKKKEQLLLKRMDELLTNKSTIDNYLRLQYIDLIAKANKFMPDRISDLSSKAIQILRESQKLRPYYTRAWIYNALYINKYLESNPNLAPEVKKKLSEEARLDLKKAKELSPKRPEIFITSTEGYLINREYLKAKKEAEQCLKIAPDNGACWWARALSLVGLNKIEEAAKNMEIASKKGYGTETKYSIGQLITLYGRLAKQTGEKKYYQKLAGLYQKLIQVDLEEIEKLKKRNINKPENFQYHASLAYIYKILGEYDKAREEALIVMKLSPASKKSVENFLKTLPLAK